MIMSRLGSCVLVAVALLAATLPGRAQQQAPALVIGIQQAPSSLDPHHEGSTPNINALAHLYDCLVEEEAPGVLRPGLALSWRVVGPEAWEFVLREGVRFHDGTPFVAEDVAFTVERVRGMSATPNPLTPFVRSIRAVEIVEPGRVRITTDGPNPFLPRDLAYVRMLSRRIHAAAEPRVFAEGRADIGTGPYRLIRSEPQRGHVATAA